MQSDARGPEALHPNLHIAIILDGNGRWAARRGKPRSAGHRAGARAVRRTVEAAGKAGVGTLTLFAFSADNWRRPAGEVRALMDLFERYLAGETARCIENGVRLNIIGRRDRLKPRLVRAVEGAEKATAGGERMLLRIAVDYSARESLTRAAGLLSGSKVDEMEKALEQANHSVAGVPPVDLLIRTSGERRLSDFLLWESAYAELYFTPALWPDFGAQDLDEALREFQGRERRFGAVPVPDEPAVPAVPLAAAQS